MMVDPAPQAASNNVNGSAATARADVEQILEEPLARTSPPRAANAGPWDRGSARELVATPAGLSRKEKCLWRKHLESAVVQQELEIGEAEVDQMARHVDPVPALAKQKELPACRVGDLYDQAAIGPEQFMRGSCGGKRRDRRDAPERETAW